MMFDQGLLFENKFTQFTLSKLLSFLVYTKFTQVYTVHWQVCTGFKFTPNLHKAKLLLALIFVLDGLGQPELEAHNPSRRDRATGPGPGVRDPFRPIIGAINA